MAYPNLGTYSSERAWTPSNILPIPGEAITYDWMDALAQFAALRYTKYVGTQVNGFNGAGPYGTIVFHYESLNCDMMPPYLMAYVKNTMASSLGWCLMPNNDASDGWNSEADNSNWELGFREVGLGTAVLYWRTLTMGSVNDAEAHDLYMIAYL